MTLPKNGKKKAQKAANQKKPKMKKQTSKNKKATTEDAPSTELTVTQIPKRRGAPSMYSKEIVEEICWRLGSGQTLKSICSLNHMPEVVTVFSWEQKYPEFAKLSMRAREHGTHVLADQCIEIADDPILDPQDKRIRIDTRIRLIGKWNAKKYGDKIEHEVKTEFMPLDELKQKIIESQARHT